MRAASAGVTRSATTTRRRFGRWVASSSRSSWRSPPNVIAFFSKSWLARASECPEALGLQRKHLRLDGERPHLKVRQAVVRRRIEPPKTKYGRRDVALPVSIVGPLRSHLSGLPDHPESVVFPTLRGTHHDADNLRRRVLKPLMEEIDAPWAAFHTLRHAFASLQIAQGVNVVQLSRALGHHSAAFTLEEYVHLLPQEEAPALDLALALGGQRMGNGTPRIADAHRSCFPAGSSCIAERSRTRAHLAEVGSEPTEPKVRASSPLGRATKGPRLRAFRVSRAAVAARPGVRRRPGRSRSPSSACRGRRPRRRGLLRGRSGSGRRSRSGR